MSIRVNSFGGPLVWLFRKHFSNFTSSIMLNWAAKRYDQSIRTYIAWFNERSANAGEAPLFLNVMIETHNRCNGKCEFCPANVRDEKRPYKKMSDETFRNIIDQLAEQKWGGSYIFGH